MGFVLNIFKSVKCCGQIRENSLRQLKIQTFFFLTRSYIFYVLSSTSYFQFISQILLFRTHVGNSFLLKLVAVCNVDIQTGYWCTWQISHLWDVWIFKSFIFKSYFRLLVLFSMPLKITAVYVHSEIFCLFIGVVEMQVCHCYKGNYYFFFKASSEHMWQIISPEK